jgi:hypothetical protein
VDRARRVAVGVARRWFARRRRATTLEREDGAHYSTTADHGTIAHSCHRGRVRLQQPADRRWRIYGASFRTYETSKCHSPIVALKKPGLDGFELIELDA